MTANRTIMSGVCGMSALLLAALLAVDAATKQAAACVANEPARMVSRIYLSSKLTKACALTAICPGTPVDQLIPHADVVH